MKKKSSLFFTKSSEQDWFKYLHKKARADDDGQIACNTFFSSSSSPSLVFLHDVS